MPKGVKILGAESGEYGRWGNTSNFKTWFCFTVRWTVSYCRYILEGKKLHVCLRIAGVRWFRSMLLYIRLLIVFALGNVQESFLYDPKEQWVTPSRWEVMSRVENSLYPIFATVGPNRRLVFYSQMMHHIWPTFSHRFPLVSYLLHWEIGSQILSRFVLDRKGAAIFRSW